MPRKITKTPATTVSVKALASQKKVAEVDMGWCASATASPLLLAQVLHTDEQRRRVRRAHTKDRAEVRGGGRKPWRQKGTGRSRHGSSRSPIWVGGGTTFGPRSRHEHLHRLPASMRRRALRAAISETLREERLQVVRMDKELPTKTRDLAKLLPDDLRSLLIITTDERFPALHRVGTNMPNVTVVAVSQLTVVDAVSAQQIWLDEAALDGLRQHGAWKK